MSYCLRGWARRQRCRAQHPLLPQGGGEKPGVQRPPPRPGRAGEIRCPAPPTEAREGGRNQVSQHPPPRPRSATKAAQPALHKHLWEKKSIKAAPAVTVNQGCASCAQHPPGGSPSAPSTKPRSPPLGSSAALHPPAAWSLICMGCLWRWGQLHAEAWTARRGEASQQPAIGPPAPTCPRRCCCFALS